MWLDKDAGYIFYSNKVAYSQKFNIDKVASDFKMKLNKWNGTVVEILVNGSETGIIACAPDKLDVTDLLGGGENEVAVRVVGSLKNTFGQFYQKEKLDIWFTRMKRCTRSSTVL